MAYATQYRFPFSSESEEPGDHAPSTFNAADSSLFDLQLVMGNQLDEGDVLVIIDIGDDLKEFRACDGKRWQSMRIRMKSEKLLNLGSSKITNMFSPQRQERIRRRLRLGVLPSGVQYVLDLTPPSEGSELADLTAALWLPKMVKLWFLAGHFKPDLIITKDDTGMVRKPLGDKAVGPILALGHDDVCKSESCLVDISQWEVNPAIAGIFEDDIEHQNVGIPEWRRVDDYCRIRHCASILRLLRFINGHSLLLNSATRMWTVAQVAIHLEVPRVVRDPVTQWLIAAPNSKFIEICPEKAFQLAYALEIPSVLVASFRILVNEAAIGYAANLASPRPPTETWVQRKRDDYGDFPSDPVQYASRAFADRIHNILAMLRSDSVLDTFEKRIDEWDKLRALGPAIDALPDGHRLKTAYTALVDALVAIFHRKVANALDTHIQSMARDLIEAQRRHYLRSGLPIDTLYKKLNDHQKAMTPFFWNNLKGTFHFEPLAESTYQGVQLWKIVMSFNVQMSDAVEHGHIPSPTPFPAFTLRTYSDQLFCALLPLCNRMTVRWDGDSSIVYFLSDHLTLTLEESELNYLPIWAGGLDDGSGGVFQETVPSTDMGPSEPGPAYHTGHTIQAPTDASTATMTDAASTIGPLDLGIGDLDIYTDAGVRSMDANQSVTTAPARGLVVAMSDDGASEQFSMADEDFADARFDELVDNRAEDSIADTADGSESVAWSYIGSVVDGSVKDAVPPQQPAPVTSTAGTSVPTTSNKGGKAALDCFGLEGDDEFDFDFDDDDGTSTLDGSDFDMI